MAIDESFFTSLDLHSHSGKVKGLVSGIRASELALYPSPPACAGCLRAVWEGVDGDPPPPGKAVLTG